MCIRDRIWIPPVNNAAENQVLDNGRADVNSKVPVSYTHLDVYKRQRLYSSYYGEVSDYTKKGGVIASEIMLPPHARCV